MIHRQIYISYEPIELPTHNILSMEIIIEKSKDTVRPTTRNGEPLHRRSEWMRRCWMVLTTFSIIIGSNIIKRLQHMLFRKRLAIVKGKGMVLYSAVSSPLDRSKRFTLSSPGRPVHSDTVLGFSWKHDRITDKTLPILFAMENGRSEKTCTWQPA